MPSLKGSPPFSYSRDELIHLAELFGLAVVGVIGTFATAVLVPSLKDHAASDSGTLIVAMLAAGIPVVIQALRKYLGDTTGLKILLLALTLPLCFAGTAAADSAMLTAINAARAAHRLPPFTDSACLDQQASSWSATMQQTHRMSHAGFPSRLHACGYSTGGECVAAGQRTPQEAVNAWLHSPPHRAILLGRSSLCGTGSAGNYHCAITAQPSRSYPNLALVASQPANVSRGVPGVRQVRQWRPFGGRFRRQ